MSGLHQHPGQFSFVHDHLDFIDERERRMEEKLDKLLAEQSS
jgi:hypothetical protein